MFPPTIAMNRPVEPGETLEYMGQPFRIVQQITREAFLADLHARRERDRLAGKPPARRGVYHLETREFQPTPDVPPECQFFYKIEPA